MRVFVLQAHKASTSPFSLNDLPGSGGRMDIVARFVSSALFVSHGIRKDVIVYIILNGPEDPPKTVRFEARKLKYVSPDERNVASHIRNALLRFRDNGEIETSPGVFISRKGFEDVLRELKNSFRIYWLDEGGRDVEECGLSEGAFVLSDHLNFSEDEVKILKKYADERISLGRISLHADHCVTIIHYLLDRGTATSPPTITHSPIE